MNDDMMMNVMFDILAVSQFVFFSLWISINDVSMHSDALKRKLGG